MLFQSYFCSRTVILHSEPFIRPIIDSNEMMKCVVEENLSGCADQHQLKYRYNSDTYRYILVPYTLVFTYTFRLMQIQVFSTYCRRVCTRFHRTTRRSSTSIAPDGGVALPPSPTHLPKPAPWTLCPAIRNTSTATAIYATVYTTYSETLKTRPTFENSTNKATRRRRTELI